MINIDEFEKAKEVIGVLRKKVFENKNLIDEKNKDISDTITSFYAYGNSGEGDYASKLGMLSDLNYAKSINNIANRQLERYKMMVNRPYFGRVDFNSNGEENAYYFGIESVLENNEVLVNDWRSPIGNLYYEGAFGKAHYYSPVGIINGDITLKRQYRFIDGELKNYVDTGMNINDDLLIEILGQNSGTVMKNIVSTIQKEQNMAIRYSDDNDLLVMGVAGSGKTSIALHRIAYLVYKDSIKYDSSKICFVTPNEIFFKYIDNVLPELGEQNVVNYSLNEVARIILKMFLYKNKLRVENKIDFLEKVINDKKDIDFDVRYVQLKDFLNKKMKDLFNFKLGLKVGSLSFRSEVFEMLYFDKFKRRDYYGRKKLIKEFLRDRISNERKVTKSVNDIIDAFVDKLLPDISCFEIYKEFLKEYEYDEDIINRGVVGYEHIYPLCFINIFFKKCKLFDKYNHLLIDEYQDLNVFERDVINSVFSCNKTFVGDFNQKLFKQDYENIRDNYNLVELNESYRSTIEIFQFLQTIVRSKGINAVKRHGDKVKFEIFNSENEQINYVKKEIDSYKGKSMAIICKNMNRAKKLYLSFKDDERVSLLNVKGKDVKRGVVIGPISLVKGLEFDKVIVYDASSENYSKEIDRNYLYIACSRAINDLSVISNGGLTRYIGEAYEEDFK